MLAFWKAITLVLGSLAVLGNAALLWTFQTGYAITSSPKLWDNSIYFGSTNGYLYSISQSGNLKWKYSTGAISYSSPAFAGDGTVYVGTDSYYLYALTSNGGIKWSYYIGLNIYSSPAIGTDGTVYVGCLNGNLYAFSSSGTLKWSYNTGTRIYSSSPKLGSDGTIYIGSDTYYFYAITSSGTLKWKHFTGGSMAYSTPVITNDGTTIYVGNDDSNLYALTSSGNLKWKYTTGRVHSTPTLGTDGTIYAASVDTYIYALSSSGTLKWKYAIGGSSYSTPALDSDGTVYIGSSDGYMYAITASGYLKWRYLIGNYVYSSPLVIDKTIIIGSSDGKLYAFDDANPSTVSPTTAPTTVPTYNRCPPGTYSDTAATTCKNCPAGYYSNGYGGATSCTPCSAGYFSGSRASSCSICQPGSYSLSTSSSCTNCTAGTYSSTVGATTVTTCKVCSSGSYTIKSGSTTCTSCTPGYFTPNATTVCQACQSGYYSTTNGASYCTSCSSGTYGNKLKASTTCVACRAGTFSSKAGAQSISSCKNCAVGTYSGSAATSCQSCAQGTYADKSGTEVCTLCPAGTFSTSSKANSSLTCIPCMPGYYSEYPGSSKCSACLAGTFASLLRGSTGCSLCNQGTFSSVIGATNISTCTNCSSGYFSSRPGASKCVRCSAGTYGNALTASTSCTPCQGGTYSNEIAAASKATCKNCTVGTYSGSAATSCQSCAQGTYADKSGTEVCTLCPAGTFSTSSKANSSLTCIPCMPGYYSEYPGSSKCSACLAGTFTLLYGSTNCTACFNGTYAASTGNSFCTKCEIGMYSTAIGANSSSTCKECLSGSYTTQKGSASCITCPLGYFSPNATIICQSCPPGYYSDTYGANECKSCPPGKFNEAEASTSCVACSIATYSEAVAATSASTCKSCPYNRITASTGSTTSSDCLNPDVNFISGIFLLVIVMVIAIVYILYDRITYVGVFRRQQLVKQVTLTSLILASRIKALLVTDNSTSNSQVNYGNFGFFKFIIFIFLSVSAVTISIFITLCFHSLQIMFTVVIIWRDFTVVFILPLRDLIANAISLIYQDLAKALDPFIVFVELIGSIKLDFGAIKLTCDGSEAPAVLLVNILILIIFAFLIESEIPILITTSFANANQQLRSFLTSEKGATCTGWLFSKRFIIGCISYLISNPFIPNPMIPLLQYLIGFASFTNFVSQNGRHPSTSSCDRINSAPQIDTIIAIWTTAIGYIILPAIIYIVSKLLVPTISNKVPESHITATTISREHYYRNSTRKWYLHDAYRKYEYKQKNLSLLVPTISNKVPESRITTTIFSRVHYYLNSAREWYFCETYREYKNEQKNLSLSIYPRKVMTICFEPIWVFFALASHWFDFLLQSTRSDGTSIFTVENQKLYQPQIVHIPLPYRVFTQSDNDVTEWNDSYERRLPTITVLVTLVAEEYHTLGCPVLMSYVLSLSFIPHFFTKFGSNCWYFIVYNYITFTCVCFGVWDKTLVNLFMLEEKIQQFITDVERTDEKNETEQKVDEDKNEVKYNRNDNRKNNNNISQKNNFTAVAIEEALPDVVSELDSETQAQVSSLLSAIVGTRVILFMLLPFCSLIATFAIATAGCPLLLESTRLLACLPPLIIPNSREIAKERLKYTGSTVYRSSWIVYFTSWSIFVSESRFIQFLVAVSKWILTVSILFFPHQLILIFCVGILFIYCIFNSLGMIGNLAIVMRINCQENNDCKDINIPFLLEGYKTEVIFSYIAKSVLFFRKVLSGFVAVLLILPLVVRNRIGLGLRYLEKKLLKQKLIFQIAD